jgi:hypothetical protein
MGTYRKEWNCCGSVTETEAWEPDSCPFCTPDPVTPPAQASDCATCEGHGEVSVQASDEPMREYRVGWFWSSANPENKVRCLAEGKEIFEYEKRGDFIEWCDAPSATADLERVLDVIASHIADNWPMNRYVLSDIEDGIRAIPVEILAATKGAKP